MTAFLIAATILVLVVTATLLLPLMRRAPSANPAGESPALKILREQRNDLESEHAAGKIDEASYAQTLSEIEARALEESAAPEAAKNKGPRLGWAIAVGVALPIAAIGIYLIIGNPVGLDPEKTIARQEDQVTPDQIDAMVAKLAERVKTTPDDIKALQMLGRSYMVLSRFGEAAKVFAQLAEKQPQDAQVFADWADAVAGVQDRQLAGEPAKLIAKALALDPENIKALALSGTLAFERQDYKGAVAQWQKIAARVPEDTEFGQSVRAMIAEASKLGGLSTEKPATVAAAPALGLKGRVSIASALKSQVGADDTLFIFARPEAGGPPVAGMRFKASELPVDFDFSKAQMMMGSVGPQDKVIIGARVSKSGNAIAASGDLQGFSAAVPSSSTKAIRIEIAEQVSKLGGLSTEKPAAVAAAPALGLKGRITIASALKSQVGTDDTLFIFARPEAGGPPVAGMRFKASELPVDFDFSKAQMMMGSVGPQDKVIIGARVSKSGNAIAASGDLQGFSAAVPSSSTKTISIEIAEQVK